MCVAVKPLPVWAAKWPSVSVAAKWPTISAAVKRGQLIVPDAERGVNNGKDHCSFFIAVQDLSLRPRSAQCPLPRWPTTIR